MTVDRVKEHIEAAKIESGRLESRLRAMSPEDLARASACDRWQVRDVIAHLTFVVQFQRNMMARGLAGDATMPGGARRRQAPDAPPMSEVIAQGTVSLREKLGNGLLDAFHQNYQEAFELVDSLDPNDYGKLCWHPWGPMTVADFIDLVVNELAIHGWDALSPLDSDYHIDEAALPATLAIGGKTLARMAPSGPARFRFELTDGGVMPDLIVGEKAPEEPSATLRCNSEALTLIACGRLKMEDAMASGRVVVSGDEALARELGRGLTGL